MSMERHLVLGRSLDSSDKARCVVLDNFSCWVDSSILPRGRRIHPRSSGILILDGPGANPPPIAVTILSSKHSVTLPADEKPPKLSLLVRVVDLFGSFVFLPFCVV